jgi:hypothetical protein
MNSKGFAQIMKMYGGIVCVIYFNWTLLDQTRKQ